MKRDCEARPLKIPLVTAVVGGLLSSVVDTLERETGDARSITRGPLLATSI